MFVLLNSSKKDPSKRIAKKENPTDEKKIDLAYH